MAYKSFFCQWFLQMVKQGCCFYFLNRRLILPIWLQRVDVALPHGGVNFNFSFHAFFIWGLIFTWGEIGASFASSACFFIVREEFIRHDITHCSLILSFPAPPKTLGRGRGWIICGSTRGGTWSAINFWFVLQRGLSLRRSRALEWAFPSSKSCLPMGTFHEKESGHVLGSFHSKGSEVQMYLVYPILTIGPSNFGGFEFCPQEQRSFSKQSIILCDLFVQDEQRTCVRESLYFGKNECPTFSWQLLNGNLCQHLSSRGINCSASF